jgi:hypothetical protein
VDANQDTANVRDILLLLEDKYQLEDQVLLNSSFEKIRYNKFTSGELFWNWRTKYYVANKEEWLTINLQISPYTDKYQLKYKRIVYQLQNKAYPTSNKKCYPVTLPKNFRRAFTRISIANNGDFIFKHVKII